jgi:predicted DNA-binding transcriptional regulator AlpA
LNLSDCVSTRRSAPDTTQPPRRWLRVGPAAEYLGIGVSTLDKLRFTGGGPPYSKLGATVIYDVADLDAWAAARKVRSTSQRPAA